MGLENALWFCPLLLLWINGIYTVRLMSMMEKSSPRLLASVGVARVDWYFKCIRGFHRLAFTRKGRRLPPKVRWVFRISAVTNVVILVFALIAVFRGVPLPPHG